MNYVTTFRGIFAIWVTWGIGEVWGRSEKSLSGTDKS